MEVCQQMHLIIKGQLMKKSDENNVVWFPTFFKITYFWVSPKERLRLNTAHCPKYISKHLQGNCSTVQRADILFSYLTFYSVLFYSIFLSVMSSSVLFYTLYSLLL